MKDVPKLKRHTLTERFTLPVDKGMRDQLYSLKENHNINISEWVRRILRRELDSISKDLK
jgi:hypothetical protein